MTKTRQAEIELRSLDFELEFRISPRGKKIAVAIKDGKSYYATTTIKLVAKVKEILG